MADIELVIKIPEEVYDFTMGAKTARFYNTEYYVNLILKGTPLPKGHGVLIDRSEVIKSLLDYYNGKKTIGQCIDDVPTIIEKESE